MDRAVYILPEIVLISITEIIYLVATAVLFVSYLFGRWYEKTSYYCRHGYWYEEIDMYIHNMLQMMKIVEPSKESTFEEPKSKLHGFIFLRGHIYYLTFCLLWMVSAAGIVFWDVFLIDITNSCDPSASRTQCFLSNTGFNLSAEPIDCNNLEDIPDNATFICYKYTLNIGGAFGTAGGMLSTGLILIKLIAANYAYFKKRKAICSYIFWICHLAIAAISILGILLAINLVPILREIVLEGSGILMFQFFNILISMGATFIVANAIVMPGEEEEEMLNL